MYTVLHESSVELSRQRRLRMAVQAASALCFLHVNNVVHRDVKTLNFLCDEFLRVKLCDFGYAVNHTHRHHDSCD